MLAMIGIKYYIGHTTTILAMTGFKLPERQYDTSIGQSYVGYASFRFGQVIPDAAAKWRHFMP